MKRRSDENYFQQRLVIGRDQNIPKKEVSGMRMQSRQIATRN